MAPPTEWFESWAADIREKGELERKGRREKADLEHEREREKVRLDQSFMNAVGKAATKELSAACAW